MTSEQRRENYLCDITYVTNSELGFDYLRDNLATESNSCFYVAIYVNRLFKNAALYNLDRKLTAFSDETEWRRTCFKGFQLLYY